MLYHKLCGDCSIRVLEMHNCCIRATALLEYFEWTLSKQHSRAKGVVFLCLFLAMLAVGVDF